MRGWSLLPTSSGFMRVSVWRRCATRCQRVEGCDFLVSRARKSPARFNCVTLTGTNDVINEQQ